MDYIPYICYFLQDHSISVEADEATYPQIIADATKFVLDDGGVLHRKVNERITESYIDFQFRGDLIQKMHGQYGHLLYQNLANILES